MENEYPKFLYLATAADSILVGDGDEEKIAREKGFRDVWGEPVDVGGGSDEDEREALKKKLKAAGVSFGGNSGVEKLRELAAEKGL